MNINTHIVRKNESIRKFEHLKQEWSQTMLDIVIESHRNASIKKARAYIVLPEGDGSSSLCPADFEILEKPHGWFSESPWVILVGGCNPEDRHEYHIMIKLGKQLGHKIEECCEQFEADVNSAMGEGKMTITIYYC